MKKKIKIILIIIILLLIVFFFPKSCGGGGGTGGPWTSVDCKCIGFKGKPLTHAIFNIKVYDAVFTSCYGVCLKNTCETTTIG